MGEEEGLKAKKSDFKAWYAEVIRSAELIEHTKVSGCSVFRPWAYFIWEQVHDYLDAKIKALGVSNAYFPLLIPKSVIMKEASHIEGFSPEVAWVTKGGDSDLEEPLAVRPTSETVMYDVFSNWVRSWRDLPIKINQWCNVVRWEFKTPTPFLRNREFLWQEGHTVYADKSEAEKEVLEVLDIYEAVYKDLFCIPVIKGKKTLGETFAGADYTTSVEAILPDGKSIQAATSHHLGRHFSKAYDIKYLDKDGKYEFAYQNSWGFTTRSIGVMIIAHGDDKGLVLPPAVAKYQVVIVPIFKDDNKELVLGEAKKLAKKIKARVFLDDSDKSPGWKFNHWELMGVPLRIELGPRDIGNKQCVVVKRNNGEKRIVKLSDLDVKSLLCEVSDELYAKAVKVLGERVKKAKSKDEIFSLIGDGFAVKACSCGDERHEIELKDKLGAKSANMPFMLNNSSKEMVLEKPFTKKCAFCDKEATDVIIYSRQY